MSDHVCSLEANSKIALANDINKVNEIIYSNKNKEQTGGAGFFDKVVSLLQSIIGSEVKKEVKENMVVPSREALKTKINEETKQQLQFFADRKKNDYERDTKEFIEQHIIPTLKQNHNVNYEEIIKLLQESVTNLKNGCNPQSDENIIKIFEEMISQLEFIYSKTKILSTSNIIFDDYAYKYLPLHKVPPALLRDLMLFIGLLPAAASAYVISGLVDIFISFTNIPMGQPKREHGGKNKKSKKHGNYKKCKRSNKRKSNKTSH